MRTRDRRFRYAGEPMLTRGDFGVPIEGGYTVPAELCGWEAGNDASPDVLYVFDPDVGDIDIGRVDACLASGEWVEEAPYR